jgi:hypothetical protein
MLPLQPRCFAQTSLLPSLLLYGTATPNKDELSDSMAISNALASK